MEHEIRHVTRVKLAVICGENEIDTALMTFQW